MNKNHIVFFLLSLVVFSSCTSRDKLVDRSKLLGYDYRLFQQTPAWELAKAVQDVDDKKISSILEQNPELINFQEPRFGETLLYLTMMRGDYLKCKLLLSHHADVNIKNYEFGRNVLTDASGSFFINVQFLQDLLDAGADVNTADDSIRQNMQGGVSSTPLMEAAENGNLEAVKLLISVGANINYRSSYSTALTCSLIQDYYSIALYLLEHGANCNVVIIKGEGDRRVYLKEFLQRNIERIKNNIAFNDSETPASFNKLLEWANTHDCK